MKIKIKTKFNFLEAAETLFVVIGFLFMTKGLHRIFPDFIITLLRYGILIFSFGFICLCLNRAMYIIKRSWPIVIVISLNIVSFLWSDFPEHVLLGIRSEMLPMSFFALYLATRITLRRQLELLSYSLIIVILLSFGIAAILPEIGIGAQGFRGIYVQKNVASTYGVVAGLVFLSFTHDRQSNRLKAWIGYGLALIFVLATTSKTGLVLVFFVPFGLYLYTRLSLRSRFAAAYLFWLLLILGIAILVIIDNWSYLLSIIGGDPTLTGRTPQWSFMLEELGNRPWLGFGRNAFWAPETYNTIRAGQAVTPYGYTVYHAHNGFIEMLLDIGLIGTFIFLISLFITCGKAFANARLASKAEDIWPVGFLLLLILNNVTESFLSWNLNLFWVLYLSLCFSLASKNKILVKSKSSISPHNSFLNS